MASWRKVKLGEIGRIAMCKRILKSETSATGEIPFYKIGTFGRVADAFISQEKFEDFSERFSYPKRGNILISAAGTIGKLVVFDGAPSYFQDSNIVWLEHDGAILYDRYLYYFLKNHKWQITQGATIQRLYNSDIAETAISLPPLPIQQKIADILGAYDDAIENNRRRIELLEKMARELYRERFVRRAGKNSEWRHVKLGDIISFRRGVGYGLKDIITGDNVLLSMNNIRPFGGFIRDYSRRFSGRYHDYQKVNVGDLIMSITDMTQDRRIIGYVGLVPPGKDNRIICTHLMKVSSDDCHPYFLNGMFNYTGFSKIVSEYATGATVLGLTADVLKEIPCRLPPKGERDFYVRQVKSIIEAQFNLEDSNENLARQRDRLLPRLMSGRLDVEKLVKEGV